MTQIRRTLNRFEGLNHVRYLTCSCFRRLPLFSNDAIKDTFVEHLSFVQRVMGFDLYAWVIMPEHFHLLLRPALRTARTQHPDGMLCGTRPCRDLPESQQTVTQILRRVKSSFGKQVITRWRELDAPILSRVTDAQGTQRFWQTGGGYDRNIFSEEELFEKIQYVHANPVRRGLVQCATEYRWSSARHHEGEPYDRPVIVPIS